MKQFNLDEYLKDPSKKVITRNGRSIRIVCTDKIGINNYPVVGLVTCTDEKNNIYEHIETYTVDGETSKGCIYESDLFFAPEKREGWINIYKNNKIDAIYFSKEEAISRKHFTDYITTIKIEWEE